MNKEDIIRILKKEDVNIIEKKCSKNKSLFIVKLLPSDVFDFDFDLTPYLWGFTIINKVIMLYFDINKLEGCD